MNSSPLPPPSKDIPQLFQTRKTCFPLQDCTVWILHNLHGLRIDRCTDFALPGLHPKLLSATLRTGPEGKKMAKKIRVTILDDHQSTVDGYLYRLGGVRAIEIVATLRYGDQLVPSLAAHPADVLLLDFGLPIAPDNPNAYPTLTEIPRLLQLYPNLDVLVVSMFAERSIIRGVMEAGASGYILKDDAQAIQDLANIIVSVADGGIFLSEKAGQLYQRHVSSKESNLSPRQLEVLLLCAAYPGSKTAELGAKMSVSNSTVRNLLSGAYLKLGIHTRAGALEKARQLGLLTSDMPTRPRA